MSAQPVFEPEDDEAGEHWLSVGDMIAGLMVIFLFIALTYMHNVIKDRDRIHEIAITYEKTKDLIYQRLYGEFKEDLKRWNAELDKETLSVRFKEPDVLFNVGSSALKEQFRVIYAFLRISAIASKRSALRATPLLNGRTVPHLRRAISRTWRFPKTARALCSNTT